MEKHNYITRSHHGAYVPGTPCKAWRDEKGQINLEFSASDIIIIDGNHWYLSGIEQPKEKGILQQIDDEIIAEMDKIIANSMHL